MRRVLLTKEEVLLAAPKKYINKHQNDDDDVEFIVNTADNSDVDDEDDY
jgi:hypothetical protein